MNNELEHNVSSFGYSGHLTMKLKRGNREFSLKKHNEGLAPLFQLICLAITGSSKCSVYLPTSVDICDATGTTSRLSKPIGITGGISMYTDETNHDAFGQPLSGVHLGAEIQRQNIITLSDISSGDCIFLKTAKGLNLARIKLTNEEITALKTLNDSTIGLSGLISWDMKFVNATDTNE